MATRGSRRGTQGTSDKRTGAARRKCAKAATPRANPQARLSPRPATPAVEDKYAHAVVFDPVAWRKQQRAQLAVAAEETKARAVARGADPYDVSLSNVPRTLAFACDVRLREASRHNLDGSLSPPPLGSQERAACFSECWRDFRFAKDQRCWNCPYWRYHEKETPF